MIFDTGFDLRDRVRIKAIERTGVVVAIWIGDIGIQYSVRYFDKAAPQTVYFFEDELELRGASKDPHPSPPEDAGPGF